MTYKLQPRVACRQCGAHHAKRRDGKRLCQRCLDHLRRYGVERPLKTVVPELWPPADPKTMDCPCGGKITVGRLPASGKPYATHDTPPCERFVHDEVTVFLAWVNRSLV